jgi:hypothetical protein
MVNVQKRKEKRIYEAPKLSFTPLKPEERFLQCGKSDPGVPLCEVGGLNS